MRALIPELFLLSAVGFGQAQQVDALLEKKTMSALQELAGKLDGVMGVAAIDLTTGHTIAMNATTVFPQASSIKIPVMIQVFRDIRRGKLRMEQEVAADVNNLVDSSPRFKAAAEATGKMTIRQLIEAMIEVSDNAATNVLIQLVGMANVNAWLDSVQLKQTRLRRKMIDIAAATRNEENVSTPLEMAALVAKLYRGEVIDKAASAEMIEILSRVKGDFRGAIPEGVGVAAKPGELTGVRCETGIVYLDKRPFVLSVTSAFLGEKMNPVPEVAKIIFRHFEMLAKSNRYGRSLQ